MNGLIQNLTGDGLQNLGFLTGILLNGLGMLLIELQPIMYDFFYEAPSIAGPLASMSGTLGGFSANIAQMLP